MKQFQHYISNIESLPSNLKEVILQLACKRGILNDINIEKVSCYMCNTYNIFWKLFIVGHNSPIVRTLKYEKSVLHSIHSSGKLIGLHYVNRQHALIYWPLETGEVSCSFSICGAAQFFRIKALDNSNTYLSSRRSFCYLNCS